MKKTAIAFLVLFASLSIAETWEAQLEQCQDFGGFWFPGHALVEKGEPWIKPFPDGGSLSDYGETGVSFNYDVPGWKCLPGENCPEFYNVFSLRYTDNAANRTNAVALEDSIYVYVGCGRNGDSIPENELTAENISLEDFRLLEKDGHGLFMLDTLYLQFAGGYICNLSGERLYYFIYKKYTDRFEYTALCSYAGKSYDHYKIQCEFQDDGSLNFGKIPDANAIPEDFCEEQDLLNVKRVKPQKSSVNTFFYKANGVSTSKGSSNVFLNQNGPVLFLKSN